MLFNCSGRNFAHGKNSSIILTAGISIRCRSQTTLTSFWLLNVHKNSKILDYPPLSLVNVVCERPLPKTLNVSQSALKNLKSQLSPVLIWTNLTIGTLAAGIPITLQTTLARKVRNCLVILSQAFFCSSLEILIVSTPLSVFSAFWRPGINLK